MMNILTSIRHVAGATLLLAGLAGPALAADDLRIDDAWKAALVDQHGVLTEKQVGGEEVRRSKPRKTPSLLPRRRTCRPRTSSSKVARTCGTTNSSRSTEEYESVL